MKKFVKTSHEQYKNVQGKSLDHVILDEGIQQAVNDVKYWVSRAWVCVHTYDYKSAIDRMKRALDAFDWLKIKLAYSRC